MLLCESFDKSHRVTETQTSKEVQKLYRVAIQIKATEQYFSVVLFIMLYMVVLLSLWTKS